MLARVNISHPQGVIVIGCRQNSTQDVLRQCSGLCVHVKNLCLRAMVFHIRCSCSPDFLQSASCFTCLHATSALWHQLSEKLHVILVCCVAMLTKQRCTRSSLSIQVPRFVICKTISVQRQQNQFNTSVTSAGLVFVICAFAGSLPFAVPDYCLVM